MQFNVDGTDFGAAVPLDGPVCAPAPHHARRLGNHTVTATYLGDTQLRT